MSNSKASAAELIWTLNELLDHAEAEDTRSAEAGHAEVARGGSLVTFSALTIQFAAGRMEPRGRERHRWVKPRGREERERISQSAVADALTVQRIRGLPKPWRRRHVATARVLLRDISKILFPNNPVNVPVIK